MRTPVYFRTNLGEFSHYRASKATLEYLTRACALELASVGMLPEEQAESIERQQREKSPS